MGFSQDWVFPCNCSFHGIFDVSWEKNLAISKFLPVSSIFYSLDIIHRHLQFYSENGKYIIIIMHLLYQRDLPRGMIAIPELVRQANRPTIPPFLTTLASTRLMRCLQTLLLMEPQALYIDNWTSVGGFAQIPGLRCFFNKEQNVLSHGKLLPLDNLIIIARQDVQKPRSLLVT